MLDFKVGDLVKYKKYKDYFVILRGNENVSGGHLAMIMSMSMSSPNLKLVIL